MTRLLPCAPTLTGEDGMSRALATSLAVFAVLMPGAAVVASAQAPAPGLVTIQKLSAPLANELVGESVAAWAQKGDTPTAGGRRPRAAGRARLARPSARHPTAPT